MSGEGAFFNDLAMRLREIGVHITNIHGNFSLIPIAAIVPPHFAKLSEIKSISKHH
jgi:hypothetical protein